MKFWINEIKINARIWRISKFKNVSVWTSIIEISFHSIFKIFEFMNSTYAVYQTLKIWDFSTLYVMVKNKFLRGYERGVFVYQWGVFMSIRGSLSNQRGVAESLP